MRSARIPLVVVGLREERSHMKETWIRTVEWMADSIFDSAVQYSRLEAVGPSKSCLDLVSGNSLDSSWV